MSADAGLAGLAPMSTDALMDLHGRLMGRSDIETRERQHYLVADPGLDYCHSCAVLRAQAIFKEAPWDDTDLTVRGGVDFDDFADSPAFCECCKTPLCFTLTESGKEDELAQWLGFLDYEPAVFDDLTPAYYYELSELFLDSWYADGQLRADLEKLGRHLQEVLYVVR